MININQSEYRFFYATLVVETDYIFPWLSKLMFIEVIAEEMNLRMIAICHSRGKNLRIYIDSLYFVKCELLF